MKNVVTRLFKSHGNKIIFFCNNIYMQHFPLACLEYSCSFLGLANLFSVSHGNSSVFLAAKGRNLLFCEVGKSSTTYIMNQALFLCINIWTVFNQLCCLYFLALHRTWNSPWLLQQCPSYSRSRNPHHVKVNILLLAIGCRAAAWVLLNHSSIAQGL